MKVELFSLVADSVLQRVCGALSQVANQWAAQWGVKALTLHAERACEAVAPTPAGAWACARTREQAAWFAWHADWTSELQRQMFSPDGAHGPQPGQPEHIAPVAARKAFDALASELTKAIFPNAAEPAVETNEAPDAGQWRRGSGAIAVVIRMGTLESRLLLSGACVRALFPSERAVLPALPAVDIRAAVAGTEVALDLNIGATRVILGNLMSLEVGDVIRLDTSVEAPIAMTLPSGVHLFTAHLGKIGDDIAVEIAGLN